MIDSELNKTRGRELENFDRQRNKQIILFIAILLLIFNGIYFLKPEITGFIAVEKQLNYFIECITNNEKPDRNTIKESVYLLELIDNIKMEARKKI